jgi:hypothetical protein
MKEQCSSTQRQLFTLLSSDTILMMTPNTTESYGLVARNTVILKSLVSKNAHYLHDMP